MVSCVGKPKKPWWHGGTGSTTAPTPNYWHKNAETRTRTWSPYGASECKSRAEIEDSVQDSIFRAMRPACGEADNQERERKRSE